MAFQIPTNSFSAAAAVLVLTSLLSACGGGVTEAEVLAADEAGDTPSEAAQAAWTLVQPVPPADYPVTPGELLLNAQFDQGLAYWTPARSDTTLIASERRSGGRALRATGLVQQYFSGHLLEPGKSYTLKVQARNVSANQRTSIAVRFRERTHFESYRTYACEVTSTSYRECRVEFTVPSYGWIAELAVMPNVGTTTVIDSASLVMRGPIARTEPVTTLVGSHVPPGYGLVFNDEFNGPALNRSKWFTRFIYDGETRDRLNDEQQRYRDNDNHRIANGILSLTARKVSSNDPAGINYESGMLRSDWTMRHGYVEARVRMPGGKGVWPAFWLNPDVSAAGVRGWPPEIDIFEVVNNGQEDTMNMLHTGVIAHAGQPSAPFLFTDPAFNTTWTFWRAPYNFHDGWHTVAAEWTPDSVTTYVNGKKIVTRAYEWKLADGTDAGPAHILLNLAIGGSWAGRHGIDDSAFPQALQINWVRAYQKVN